MSYKLAYKFFPHLEDDYPKKFTSVLRCGDFGSESRRNSVQNLFAEIWKQRHKDLRNTKLQERINRKAFKNKQSPTYINKCYSSLNQAILAALASEKSTHKPTQLTYYAHLFEALNIRRVPFKKVLPLFRAAEKIKNKTPQTLDSYSQWLKILREKLEFENHKEKRTTQSDLLEYSRFHQVVVLTERLKMQCAKLNRKQMFSKESDTSDPLLDLMIKEWQPSKENSHLLLQGYLQAYELLKVKTNNEEKIKSLLALLKKHHESLGKRELEDLFILALNEVSHLINANYNHVGYLELYAKIFSELKKQGMLITYEGKINPWNFKNYVSVLAQLGEFRLLDEFKHEMEPYLIPSHKEAAIQFTNVVKWFYQNEDPSGVLTQSEHRDWESVVKWLDNLDDIKKDVFYKLPAKLCKMKLTYFSADLQTLKNEKSNLFSYLKRVKGLLSDKELQGYQDFASFILDLARAIYTNPSKPESIEEILNELQKKPNTVSYNWLVKEAKRKMGEK